MELFIVLSIVAIIASAQATLQDQAIAKLDAVSVKSQADTHTAFLRVYNATYKSLDGLNIKLLPNYNNFKHATAGIQFDNLSTDTAANLRALISLIDFYLSPPVQQLDPASDTAALSQLWPLTYGFRKRPTPLDLWFTMGSYHMTLSMVQDSLRTSVDSCVTKLQSTLVDGFKAVAAPIIAALNAVNVKTSFTESVAATNKCVAKTNSFIKTISTCSGPAAETCFKNFLTTKACVTCNYIDDFQGPFNSIPAEIGTVAQSTSTTPGELALMGSNFLSIIGLCNANAPPKVLP